MFSIRLVSNDYEGEAFIQNKIYLHPDNAFAGLIEENNFKIVESFHYGDRLPGTYGVFLCERLHQRIECRIAKSNRIVFVYHNTNKTKTKLYQAFNDQHAQFISSVTQHRAVANFFPKIHAIKNEFIETEWVDGSECLSGHIDKRLEILFCLYALECRQESHFDYVEDLIIPRFYSLHPLVGSLFCKNVVERIQKGSDRYTARISHPDLTVKNIISAPNGLVVIDNELICKTKHHRIDLLNMVLSSSTKTHDEIIKKFLNIEKITMNDFGNEYPYLNALWVARQSGSYLMRGQIELALAVINKYKNNEWVLPFTVIG